MASGESKRLALVVAGGLIVGLGLAAGYFLVLAPHQQRGQASKQIAAWEQRWTAAAECLFGSRRRGTDLAEAIALAPFDDARPDDSECNRRIGKLSRPEGPAIALDAVEAAWTELEARAVVVARRYGAFVSSPLRERAELAAAAAELDRAHDRLRATAGLPVLVRALDGTPLPSLQPVSVGPDGQQLVELHHRRLGDGLVQVRVATIGAVFDVAIRGPGEATVQRLDRASVRSWPAAAWGAVVTADGDGEPKIRAGAIASDGVVSGGVLVAVGDDAAVELVAALGDGPDRIVIGGDARRARLFRSRDGGATWAGSDLKGATRVRVDPDPAAAAVDLFWQADGSWRWTRFQADTVASMPEVVTLDTPPEATCATAGNRWAIAGSGAAARVVRVAAVAGAGGGKPELALAEASAVLACSADAALVVADDDFARCDAGGCRPVLAEVPATARADASGGRGLAAVDAEHAVFAAQRGDLVGVWGLGKDERFVRIPDSSRALALVVHDGRGHLVLWGDPGLTVAPLP